MNQNSRCKLTFLVEDSVGRPRLLAEHGLSVLVECENNSVLFDTGQTDLLLRNAEELGIELGREPRSYWSRQKSPWEL
ncbi:hypothetical protein HQ563_02415 [bacterium]|nr:hypothetical protein [bacterium]